MGLRCDECLDEGIEDFKKYATKRDLKVTINKYDGNNKCGGCGKVKATNIITYD